MRRFQEEEDASDYVTQLSTDLHTYPPQHVLVGPYLHQDFDPKLVSTAFCRCMPAQAEVLFGNMTRAG
jgi:hypothetical protein